MSPRVGAPSGLVPNADQQAEFERQLAILIEEHKSYTSIVTWVRIVVRLHLWSKQLTHGNDIDHL